MNDLSIIIAAEFALAEKIAECLEQSELVVERLTVAEIYPFSEEQGIRFNNRAVAQVAIDEIEWSEHHYVFFAGDIEQAAYLAQASNSGCVVIDMKGVCAGLSDVPVVVPSVNDEQLGELRQRNIVALPDPQVSQAALAIAPLAQENLSQIMVTSLLPASYVSGETVNKLVGQTAQLLNGIPLDENVQRLAFDVFPVQTTDLSAQWHKIFPQIKQIIFHQVQAPVFYGLAQSITVQSDYELEPQISLNGWENNEFIHYYAEKTITPVTNGETENSEDTASLHISNLSAVENQQNFWTVSDEQRFTLARLAVKLAESIYLQGY
ncbi:aspartate-semialdehyde dehydrogenase [Cricetibacter osteomyelitidis]|uniref:Aspartate-semialdehyde dehydrogenase n=1 Tax=Cricetibacter osteomyelitidis TaxID=1521931 RepID=A0A4R2SPT2_9PAST|nr:oxidoreductase [Cricetibacter osteomyelitidis]TCP91250.1 aspartate-semialdehyde dehydrogenase [Cricetibacter osteomyelitidis]